MMKLLLLPFACAPVAAAYQIGGSDNNAAIRQAIERSTKKTVSVVPTTVDEQGPADYWFHPQIHTFGNTGILGGLHAAVAPLCTKLIDVLAYDGDDVRSQISRDLHRVVGKSGARVVDLCCGVGISTRSLQEAFSDAEVVIGVDTSPEMVAMAETYSDPKSMPSKVVGFLQTLMGQAKGVRIQKSVGQEQTTPLRYSIGNAECTGFPDKDFDLVTIMYGFHEAPYVGRDRILREARRLLKDGGTLAVVDISPSYKPSPTMLAGEPYVLEYKAHIQDQLRHTDGFTFEGFTEVVPNHVGVWLLKQSSTTTSMNAPWETRPVSSFLRPQD